MHSTSSSSNPLIPEAKLTQEEEYNNAHDPSAAALRTMLSLAPIIPTPSEQHKSSNFHTIDHGTTTTTFSHPGTDLCYKLPLPHHNPYNLWTDYKTHLSVQEAFDSAHRRLETTMDVEVPRVFWFANATTERFWGGNLERFPWGEKGVGRERRCEVVCMERIPPLPTRMRDFLVGRCWPPRTEGGKEAAGSYTRDKDCLVRPLLGRRRGHGAGTSLRESRGFRLYVDQLEHLGVDPVPFALAMADAMAVLHGVAKIDAKHIKFVVGSPPSDKSRRWTPLTSAEVNKLPPCTSTYERVTARDSTRRVLTLWVLGFDACRSISMDDAGVRAAVDAFGETEPYCPRPKGGLWGVFGRRYRERFGELGLEMRFAEGFLRGVRGC